MNKSEFALKQFDKGYNCAQSLLTAFTNEINIEEKDLLLIASGFGGGMGQLQLTCGAVTGAFMALSLKYGSTDPDDKEAKDRTKEKIREFEIQFRERNATTSCRELLGCDMRSDEGKAKIVEGNLYEKVCTKVIEDAVDILKTLK